MTRVVLVLLAALAAGIGFATQFRWLYAGASVLLLIALGLWVRDMLKERRREERRAARAEATTENDDLRSLGIMEVRPKKKEAGEKPDGEAEAEASAEAPQQARKTDPAPHESPADHPTEPEAEAPLPEAESPEAEGEQETPSEKLPEGEPARPVQAATAKPSPEAQAVEERASEEAPVEGAPPESASDRAANQEALDALVRALRLAAGAQAACLLAQEELALRYRIEARDGAGEGAPPLREVGAAFSTEAPLLSASAARQPVTQASVGEEGLAPHLLGYYQHPADLQGAAPDDVALVPVPLPDEPTTRFLLLDGPRGAFEGKDTLLKRFAALFAQVIVPAEGRVEDSMSSEPKTASVEKPPAAENGQAASERDAPARDPARDEEPRPRREIIAEEMKQARADGRDLALALVYLNRAETVAERGAEEVRAAERALRARLRQAAPDGRVEPFGELTYGVFLQRGRAEAEGWAVALQEELDRASDPLEGGVSVGLALMRGPEQTPTALRENATNALREAYTTGTCTILE